MAKGRRPKPTYLKIIDGNPGKRAIGEAEPQPRMPQTRSPRAPRHLDEHARNEWARVVPELVRMGLYTVVDQAALEAYCSCYSQWRRACDEIDKAGETYETVGKSGGVMWRARPQVAIANEALRQMRAFAAEFGLTPAARVRLRGAAQGELPLDGGDRKSAGAGAGWGSYPAQ